MKTKIFLAVLLCINLCIVLYVFSILRTTPNDKPLNPGWRKIYIDSVGKMQIPQDWIFSRDSKTLLFTDKFLTDKDYKLYLIGFFSNTSSNIEVGDYHISFIKNVMSTKIKNTEFRFGKDLVTLIGEETQLSYISTVGEMPLKIYSLSSLADEEVLIKMAESSTYIHLVYEISGIICV